MAKLKKLILTTSLATALLLIILTVIGAILIKINIFWDDENQPSTEPNLTELDRAYTKEEIESDLNYLINKFERIHPDPYLHTSKEAVEEFKASTIKALPEQVSSIQARRAISAVTAKFGWGHSSVLVYPSLSPEEKENFFPFPLGVEIKNGQLYTKENISNYPDLAEGSEIISINGIPAPEIVDNLLDFVSFQVEGMKLDSIRGYFGGYLVFYYGFTGPDFEVEIREGADISSYTLQKISEGKVFEAESKLATEVTNPPDFTLSFIENNSASEIAPPIAVMDLNSFGNKKGFAVFLKDAFLKILAKESSTLIVDVRGNGGVIRT